VARFLAIEEAVGGFGLVALKGSDAIATGLARPASFPFGAALALATAGALVALVSAGALLALVALLPGLSLLALLTSGPLHALGPLGSGGTAGTGDRSLDDLLGVGDRVDVLNVLVLVHVLDGLPLVEVLGDGLGDPGLELGFESGCVDDGLGLGLGALMSAPLALLGLVESDGGLKAAEFIGSLLLDIEGELPTSLLALGESFEGLADDDGGADAEGGVAEDLEEVGWSSGGLGPGSRLRLGLNLNPRGDAGRVGSDVGAAQLLSPFLLLCESEEESIDAHEDVEGALGADGLGVRGPGVLDGLLDGGGNRGTGKSNRRGGRVLSHASEHGGRWGRSQL